MFLGIGSPKIAVEVTFMQLESLNLGGASFAYSLGEAVLSDSFQLKVSGASEADLWMTAPSVKVEVSGASDVVFSGQSDMLTVDIS